jgi:pyrroloquinoline quinone biosynthesis protein E
MYELSPHTIIRPESKGALLFQQENAETLFLNKEGLLTLWYVVKSRPLRRYPLSFLDFLLSRGFLIRNNSTKTSPVTTSSLEKIIEKAKVIKSFLRSLCAPETIHLSITGSCDQRCRGCFYSTREDGKISADFIPLSLFKKVVDKASQVRVFQIALGGGEPLLHPNLTEMVTFCRQKGIVPNITTNGNRLNREIALSLKRGGIGQIQISLNGANPGSNGLTRPNFSRALKAMNLCREIGLQFGVNFLLTKSNVNQLQPVAYLVRSLGANSLNILRPKPPIKEEDWLVQESLGKEEYSKIQSVLHCLIKKVYPLRITLDASLAFLLTDHSPQVLYRSGDWGCTAARRFLTISQNGEVFPCSHVRISDVGEGKFMQAWENSKIFSHFRRQEEEIKGRCKRCQWLEVCRGCPAVTMAFGGNFNDSDPHCPHG